MLIFETAKHKSLRTSPWKLLVPLLWLWFIVAISTVPLITTASVFVRSPEKAVEIVNNLPGYAPFGYSGLAFYDKSLYAASGAGLLEFKDGSLVRLFQWDKHDSDVEGPFQDTANGLLWILVPGGKAARFDGKQWRMGNMPEPKNGEPTGGGLEDFHGLCNSNKFWLEYQWHCWAWDPKRIRWQEENTPPFPIVPLPAEAPILRMIVATDKRLMLIMAQDQELSFSDEEVQGKLKGEKVFYFDRQWVEITNDSHFVFYSEQTCSAGGIGYIRTSRGNIMAVTETGVRKLEIPGKCEALVRTSSDTLLACFHNVGVFELKSDWEFRFKTPYPPPEPNHSIKLAEDNGLIALADTPKPRLSNTYKIVVDSVPSLWTFDGRQLSRIKFPK